MSWTLRIVMSAMCAMLLMPGEAQACERIAFDDDTIDKLWASEPIEETVLWFGACEDLRVYRNTIFARHGFDFENEWVLAWFTDNEPRWKPVTGMDNAQVEGELSQVDWANLKLVQTVEKQSSCDEHWKAREAETDSVEAETEAPVEEAEEPTSSDHVVITIAGGYYEVDGVIFQEVLAAAVTPNFVIGEVFNHRTVESEWLVPFTCRDLQIVTEAVRSRSSHLSNQDKLTLLRVDRERRGKDCDQPDTD
jgi:hypothetical protein